MAETVYVNSRKSFSMNDLPTATRQRVERQAYKDKQSQYVVLKDGKYISVPQYNVAEALHRLGFKIETELILLK